MKKVIKTATQRHVMWRALEVALIVGILLNIINHFDMFYGEGWDLQKKPPNSAVIYCAVFGSITESVILDNP